MPGKPPPPPAPPLATLNVGALMESDEPSCHTP
jgi:hypothetical protein